jgi:hypothetical protein
VGAEGQKAREEQEHGRGDGEPLPTELVLVQLGRGRLLDVVGDLDSVVDDRLQALFREGVDLGSGPNERVLTRRASARTPRASSVRALSCAIPAFMTLVASSQ